MQIAGILRLLFAHHVDHLDASQDRTRAVNGLKPEHRPHPFLNGPMILLDAIVQIRTLPNSNGFQVMPRSALDPVYGIAGQDHDWFGCRQS
jgi:hypothetical protein